MNSIRSFSDASDQQLLLELKDLASRERHTTAELIACLAEVDARRLYLGEGCSSLFTYCTHVLHLSEHAAYGRIEAARAARRFPIILALLSDGDLTLTAVCLLRPHLAEENHIEMLAAARHKSKRDVEQLVAALQPKADVRSHVRKLPHVSPGATLTPSLVERSATARCEAPWDGDVADSARVRAAADPQPPRPSVIAPLAPERYKLQVTLSREGYDRLRHLQDLLRHRIPGGDPAAIVELALEVLLNRTKKERLAATKQPCASRRVGSRTRHIPAVIKREVWKRDGGQCAFVGNLGRCTERGFLELHHVVPYADAGSTTVDNLQLRCRAHNSYEAERWDGSLFLRELAVRYDANSARPELFGRSRPTAGR